MPIKLGDHEFYKTGEACRLAGTTRNTYLRWVRGGTFKDVGRWDRRGWRLFTDEDVRRLKAEVNTTTKTRAKRPGNHRTKNAPNKDECALTKKLENAISGT